MTSALVIYSVKNDVFLLVNSVDAFGVPCRQGMEVGSWMDTVAKLFVAF